MYGKQLDVILSLAGSAAFLALGVLAVLRGRNAGIKPVAWPFALLCLDLFAYNLTQAISETTAQPSWHWLNAVAASIVTPFYYHLVIAFVGRRRQLGGPLLAVYAAFLAIGVACLAPFFLEGNTFPGGGTWAVVILLGEVPVLVHSTGLLLQNMKGTSIAERARTRLVLAAGLIAGVSATAELVGIAGATWSPHLVAWGLVVSALVLGAAALRLLEGITFLSWVNAAAIALTVVLAEVAVFRAFGHQTALVVVGTVLVSLAAVASLRFVISDYARERERTLAHASLGRMAAQMAHDIKNPLASIRGAAQFLQGEREAGRSIDGQAEYLQLLVEQVDRMSNLVDQYQRIGRAKPQLQKVDLNDAAREALKFATAAGGTLDVQLADALPQCEADKELLVIALENVLRNALEAAPGKPLHVTTAATSEGPSITVRDEGPGMDPRTKERALEGFFTTKSQGSGLGLAFVRRVVEAHRGKLTLDSREGQGTTVRIELKSS